MGYLALIHTRYWLTDRFLERKLTTSKFTNLRLQMIDHQMAARDLHDRRVLDAVSAVAREKFVPIELLAL